MGGMQPIAQYNLVQDRVSGGEMGGVKFVLIRPRFNLFFNDDKDHYISLGYLYLIIYNVKATLILIDDIGKEFKCVSPHNRLLEV